jgi:hypothetical protein
LCHPKDLMVEERDTRAWRRWRRVRARDRRYGSTARARTLLHADRTRTNQTRSTVWACHGTILTIRGHRVHAGADPQRGSLPLRIKVRRRNAKIINPLSSNSKSATDHTCSAQTFFSWTGLYSRTRQMMFLFCLSRSLMYRDRILTAIFLGACIMIFLIFKTIHWGKCWWIKFAKFCWFKTYMMFSLGWTN